MGSTENSEYERPASRQLKRGDDADLTNTLAKDDSTSYTVLASLPWEIPPLANLSPEQQVRFRDQAQIRCYKLGEKIWSTDSPGEQFIIVSGKVRLREEGVSKPLSTLE